MNLALADMTLEAANQAPRDRTSVDEATSFGNLLHSLKRLDFLLERAVAAARAAYGTQTTDDLYRGLYIGQEEVARLLTREPAASILMGNGKEADELPSDSVGSHSRLDWLQATFGLSSFDIDALLIALAPELDLRYERLYAYLQDDVTRKRPSVDLVLNLLCPSTEAKLARRVHFAADAPLIFHHLVQLIRDPNQTQPPFLAHYLKVDEQIVNLLLKHERLDSRLARFCRLIEPILIPEEWMTSTAVMQALPALVIQARETYQPLRLYFEGPRGGRQLRIAIALANKIGSRLLSVELPHVLAAEQDFEQVLKLLFREAWFQDAILCLDGLDALRSSEWSLQYERLLEALAENAGITILTGAQPWVPSGRVPVGVVTVPFTMPDFAGRRACLAANLAAAGVTLDAHDLDALANRFRLTYDQIADAVVTARNHARLHSASLASGELSSPASGSPTISDLFAAARSHSGHDLATLAHKIAPVYTWNDIVLPDDALAQLREICQRVAHGQRVFGEWGFGRRLSVGKGVNALFAGPSGTGKTMAAEIIANELGLDLYKIDLAGVVSKYIGETEKNLDRIFSAAENANAILFFDEADALFGKRSEVHDSHDRYANIEISYLLQKMEEYEGVAILATNLRQNLDESFTRRLAFTIHFPFPDDDNRRRIWGGIWPTEAPLAKDLDFDFLARQFKLSGGNIKNVALAASFLAAENGGAITMAHMIRAIRREYQKLGKPLSDAELGLAAFELPT